MSLEIILKMALFMTPIVGDYYMHQYFKDGRERTEEYKEELEDEDLEKYWGNEKATEIVKISRKIQESGEFLCSKYVETGFLVGKYFSYGLITGCYFMVKAATGGG